MARFNGIFIIDYVTCTRIFENVNRIEKLTRTPWVEQYVDVRIDMMLIYARRRLSSRVDNYFPHCDGRVRRYLHLENIYVNRRHYIYTYRW